MNHFIQLGKKKHPHGNAPQEYQLVYSSQEVQTGQDGRETICKRSALAVRGLSHRFLQLCEVTDVLLARQM